MKNAEDKLKSRVNHLLHRAKHAPKYAAQRAKNLARPAARKAKAAARKSLKVAKLASNSRERKLYLQRKPALAAIMAKDWPKAAVLWRGLIDEHKAILPAEAWVQLSAIYQEMGDFDSAEKVIVEGMSTYPRSDAGTATQKDLEEWLKLSKEKAEISIRKRLAHIEGYKKDIANYKAAKKKRAKGALKIAVFSGVSGGYDTIKPPATLDPRFDYILFTDTPVKVPDIYDVRPIPYVDLDKTRSARFVKTNPHNLLSDYDIAVWVDANIMITGDLYTIINDVLASKKPLGAMKHPVRESAYDEMHMCIQAGKDDIDAITQQQEAYKKKGYKSKDLIESNVLVYDLRGGKLNGFLNDWWNHIDRYSHRDQLSINYCLDKNKVKWHAFTKRPNTARNHPELALTDHGAVASQLPELLREMNAETVDPFTEATSYAEVKAGRIKRQEKRRIDAVVCVHNALEDVKKCLDAVKKYRTKNLRLIIIDDGSDKPTEALLKRFSEANKDWTTRVRHETAKGYTKAASRGLKESTGELVVLLNSDTIVTEDWALKMADVAFTQEGVGIVGPMSSAASHQSLPNHKSSADQTAINSLPEGMTEKDMNAYCEKWGSSELIPRVPLVHGFCYGIKREVIDAIGYLDEKSFPRGYGEENDYCFRAADAGFGLALATHTYVFHAKSKSFVGEERKKLMEAGGRAFRNKHGQRRITRAVRTMEEHPVLKTLRRRADQLYTKQLLHSNKQKDEIIVPLATDDDLASMSHTKLVKKLSAYNHTLLDWKSLAKAAKRKQSTPKISVIILMFNNLAMTKRCVDSVMKAKTNLNFEVILVNNGSDLVSLLGTRELKRQYPHMKLVHVEQNVNFALGNNIGFSYAKGAISVFLNNDTYVTDHWLDNLVRPLEDESIKAVQPALLYPDNIVQSLGTVFNEKNVLGYALYVGKSRHNKKVMKSRHLQAVTAACMAVRSHDFANLEGFDPIFVNGQEDVDFCLRLTQVGEKGSCYTAADAVVYHDESKTPGRGRYVYQNRQAFVAAWAGKVQADDQAIYEADGYKIDFWRIDLLAGYSNDLAVYSPRLARKLPFRLK